MNVSPQIDRLLLIKDSSQPAVHDHDEYEVEELLKTRTTLLTGTDPAAKRQEILDYFNKTFTLYEKLFDVLKDDSVYYKQPDRLRHPLVFYYGHTAVFYINKLNLARVLTTRIDAEMEATCAIGVDEMSWDDLNTGHYNWPSIQTIRAYRRQCREVVCDLIGTLELKLPIDWHSPFWIILMGIEHERIHLETSSVLFRQLAVQDCRPRVEIKGRNLWAACTDYRSRLADVPSNALLEVPAGEVDIVRDVDDQYTYGWDNEYGRVDKPVQVQGFKASKFLVSNKEWLQFCLAGGYEREGLWSKEGWSFVAFLKREGRCHPIFWVPNSAAGTGSSSSSGSDIKALDDGSRATGAIDADGSDVNSEAGGKLALAQSSHTSTADASTVISCAAPYYKHLTAESFRYRAMAEEMDMPWDWPVDVNNLEAQAFCNWLGEEKKRVRQERKKITKDMGSLNVTADVDADADVVIRLPTEVEWCRLRDYAMRSNDEMGDQPLWKQAPGNINLEHHASSCPVDSFAFQHGFFDIIGNVWQHTATPITGFPGFKVHPCYDDFSVPTFDNKHNLIKGGSWISTGNEATRNGRYAFRRHFYQHAGLRYIESKTEVKEPASLECFSASAEPDVCKSAHFHWGDASGKNSNRAASGADRRESAFEMFFPQQMSYHKRVADLVIQAHKEVSANADRAAVDADAAAGGTLSANEAKNRPRSESKLNDSDEGAGAGASASASADAGAGADASAGADAASAASASVLSQSQRRASGASRALDLGCAAGRSTFELARYFDQVLGLDLTTRVLRAPLQLIENGYIQYEVPVENELQTYHKINLEDCGLGGCKDKVQFLQQDGCNSNTDLLKYGTFDLVLCSNLLTELYNTTNFLQSLHERVNMGGLVAFTSDYGWDEKHTPKQFVLGGFKVAGENFTSFDGLRSLLQPRFRLIQRMDVPYVLQLSKRRFEHSITDLTIWQRIR